MAININYEDIWNSQYNELKHTEVNDPLGELSNGKELLAASISEEDPQFLTIACGFTSAYPMESSDMNKAAINKRYVGCLAFTKMLNNKFSDFLEHF